MKTKQKLILGFLTIPMLVAIVGMISVYASQKVLQKHIQDESVNMAANMIEHVDKRIYSRIEQLQAYVQDLSQEPILSMSNQEFDKLDNIQKYINKKDRSWTADDNGQTNIFMEELISNELSAKIRDEFELKDFYKQRYGYEVFSEVFVTNKYGANTAQTGKTSDYYQADEIWWQKAKENGLYVGDIEYDKSAGTYSIAIGVRIDSSDREFLGVVKAVLNIAEIIDILKVAAKEYGHHDYKLITNDNRIIYSTDEFETFESIPSELAASLQKKDNHGHTLPYFIISGDKTDEGEELCFYAHSKGYKNYKGLGWKLVLEKQIDKIFAPAVKLKNWILIVSLLITVLAIVIGAIVYRSISIPINKLTKAAKQIGNGKLNTKVEIKSNDEIGELAVSFNKMTENLQKTTTSIDNLNREVAERKKAKRALESLNEDLRETVNKLTVANRELSDFAYIAAHDLKAPLRAIGCLAGILLSDYGDKLDEKAKELLDTMLKRTHRMSNLISGVLRYSEIGRTEEKKDLLDLNIVVTEAIDNINIPENIEVKLEDQLPTIMFDRIRIIQVFQNLLDNAVKYMDKSKGWIKISCVEEGDYWKIGISDDGPGIEQKYREKIFGIFQTLTSRDEREETGIGLSIAKKILEAQGGKIWVESNPGQGSTFFFTLAKQKMEAKYEQLQTNTVS